MLLLLLLLLLLQAERRGLLLSFPCPRCTLLLCPAGSLQTACFLRLGSSSGRCFRICLMLGGFLIQLLRAETTSIN